MVHEALGVNGGFADVFRKVGAEDVWDRDRIVAPMDHWVPDPSPQVADTHNECREFVKEYRITNWYGMECKGIAWKLRRAT